MGMWEDILLHCHLTIHKLNVCIKRNAFYNFQIDESFMGRCNENKDVFYAGGMLSGMSARDKDLRSYH